MRRNNPNAAQFLLKGHEPAHENLSGWFGRWVYGLRLISPRVGQVLNELLPQRDLPQEQQAP